jgi:hypothetical protein
MRRALIGLGATALLLSGCGSGDEGGAAASTSSDDECIGYGCSPEQDAEINAGEAGAGAEEAAAVTAAERYAWPDGLAVEVVEVTTEAEPESDESANDTHVLVTVRFTNTGEDPFVWGADAGSIGASGPEVTLLYGANQYEASQYSPDVRSELPRQLLPGTSADWLSSFYMPAAELDTLVLAVSPAWDRTDHAPVTVTGVEQLL